VPILEIMEYVGDVLLSMQGLDLLCELRSHRDSIFIFFRSNVFDGTTSWYAY